MILMKKLCIVTATRAEYGLLRPLIKRLRKESDIDLRLAVTGAHLSPEFGMTVHEIESDHVPIDRKIEMLLSADTPSAITKSMALALTGFADYFAESRPDALMVLGDRYEMLAVCIAALNARIPIFHIHGGEVTEGAIDDSIRHAITKMSLLHFTSTEVYRQRVIQMGESPDRVFCVGSLGVENALHEKTITKKKLEEFLEWKLGKTYAVLTFHPVTMEKNTAKKQIHTLLDAVSTFPEIRFLVTKANADTGGRAINEALENYAATHDHLRLYDSLGVKNYLSAVKHAAFVIGNSSSGIYEAPAFGVQAINIGDRQKGRIQGKNIIDCKMRKTDIVHAVREAIRKKPGKPDYMYGRGDTSSMITEVVLKQIQQSVNHKSFYDLPAGKGCVV